MISSRLKLKVQSVMAVKDAEGRDGYQIDFAEIRPRPPVVMMTPPGLPDEIGQMMVQISKSVQQVMPGGDARELEIKKLTLILTAEELEAFKLKPYPNQMYELTITDGTMSFREF